MSWRTRAATIVAVAASLLSFSTQAQTLYAATGSSLAGTLYTVNPATAAVTPVGPLLIGAAPISLTGLAMHPTTGVLYGLTGSSSPNNPNSIVTVNPLTGAATLVGATGSAGIADLAFNSAGTLYGFAQGSTLATINLATGAATLLGASGLCGGTTFGGGLAISGAGTAFVATCHANGTLDTLNVGTGAGTVGPALGGAPIPAGNVSAMAFSGAGTLFAVDLTTGGGPADLVTINTATGAVTTIGALPNATDALAFAVALAAVGPQQTPTLSEWALIALALVLGAAGSIAVARRKA